MKPEIKPIASTVPNTVKKAGVEISDEDEIVAAIKSTRGKYLMFSGDFGPSGLVGRIVTPPSKAL